MMNTTEYYDSLEQMWRNADMYEDEPDDESMDRARAAGNAGSDHEVPDHKAV